MTTYEIIKALPGKGFDWAAFAAAVRELYIEKMTAKGYQMQDDNYLAQHAAAKGVRQFREITWLMACQAVHVSATVNRVIPASPETLAWGGFLGGTHCVYTDTEKQAAVTAEFAALAARFHVVPWFPKKGR